MALADQDFSFPTTVDTPPRFIESPPLWRTTSLASLNLDIPRTKSKGERENNTLQEENNLYASKPIKGSQRKSFSCVESATRVSQDGGSGEEEEEEEEEKMDMLWEDFNEELFRTCGVKSAESDMSPPGRMAEFGCSQSVKLSRRGRAGAIVSSNNKKPSMVVFMKVLKKLFLLQNYHRPIKKQAR